MPRKKQKNTQQSVAEQTPTKTTETTKTIVITDYLAEITNLNRQLPVVKDAIMFRVYLMGVSIEDRKRFAATWRKKNEERCRKQLVALAINANLYSREIKLLTKSLMTELETFMNAITDLDLRIYIDHIFDTTTSLNINYFEFISKIIYQSKLTLANLGMTQSEIEKCEWQWFRTAPTNYSWESLLVWSYAVLSGSAIGADILWLMDWLFPESIEQIACLNTIVDFTKLYIPMAIVLLVNLTHIYFLGATINGLSTRKQALEPDFYENLTFDTFLIKNVVQSFIADPSHLERKEYNYLTQIFPAEPTPQPEVPLVASFPVEVYSPPACLPSNVSTSSSCSSKSSAHYHKKPVIVAETLSTEAKILQALKENHKYEREFQTADVMAGPADDYVILDRDAFPELHAKEIDRFAKTMTDNKGVGRIPLKGRGEAGYKGPIPEKGSNSIYAKTYTSPGTHTQVFPYDILKVNNRKDRKLRAASQLFRIKLDEKSEKLTNVLIYNQNAGNW